MIVNSLSITIAQRTREFAILRTLGATRRQVLRAVLLEAVTVGVLASVIGLFVGLGLGQGAVRAVRRGRLHAAEQRHRVPGAHGRSSRCWWASIVTVVASLRPALRATRVPPIAAVREGARRCRARGRPRGAHARARAISRLLGFARARLRRCSRPASAPRRADLDGPRRADDLHRRRAAVARASCPRWPARLGWPAVRLGGAAGRLARENARRNPQRTASTAAALMIGLALVTLVAMLAAGIISNFKGAVERALHRRLRRSRRRTTSRRSRPPWPTRAAQTPGVAVDRQRARRRGEDLREADSATASTRTSARTIKLNWKQGSQRGARELGADGAFTDDGYAKKHHLRSARRSRSPRPPASHLHVTIKGIFKPPAGGSPFGAGDDLERDVRPRPTSSRRTSSRSSTCTAARTTPTRPRSSAARRRSRTRRCRPSRSSSTTRSRA